MNISVWAVIVLALNVVGCSTLVAPADSLAGGSRRPASVVPGSDGMKSVVLPEGGATESILSCQSQRIEYIPIPALPAGGYTDIEINSNEQKSIAVLKPWPLQPVAVNKLLTNIATNISQSTQDLSGSVGGGIFSRSNSQRQYVIDFMKWRAEPLSTADGKQLGWVRVGAGMRVLVNITKDDGSATGSLLALAVSAKAGKVEGSISMELIGIDAKEVTQAMPFTVDLSEGNIQKVIEALAIVKTKLYDHSTTVSPNLIAKIECAPNQTAMIK